MLAGLFNAPLTASLLLFELTRDFDIVLPLMASAGVSSLINVVIAQRTATESAPSGEISVDDLDSFDQSRALVVQAALVWQYIGQIIGGDFAKFCGLLRIYEL